MRIKLLVLLLSSALCILTACSDDEDKTPEFVFEGSNGVLIDGDGFERLEVDCRVLAGELDESGPADGVHYLTIMMSGLTTGGLFDLNLSYRRTDGAAMTTGLYEWIIVPSERPDDFVEPDVRCFANSKFNNDLYLMSSGWTRIDELGDVVRGEFRGKLRNQLLQAGEEQVEIEVTGKFEAPIQN